MRTAPVRSDSSMTALDHGADPLAARLAEPIGDAPAAAPRDAGRRRASRRARRGRGTRSDRRIGRRRPPASPAAARSSTSGRGCRRAPPTSGWRPRAPRRCGRSARRDATPPARSTGDSASSPVWPNGEWPTSWPSAIASASGSFRLSAAASERATWVTCIVCVRRVTKWSPSGLRKTCVLCFSRRNAFEWMIRSRSRSNAVRNSSGSSDADPPAAARRARGRWAERAPPPPRAPAGRAGAARPAALDLLHAPMMTDADPMRRWRARQDSNLRPSAPEADALSTELQAHEWPMIPRRLRVPDRRRPPPKRGPSLLPDSLIARASFTHGFPHYPNPNLPMALRSVVNRWCEQHPTG